MDDLRRIDGLAGKGGETHQVADADRPALTTNRGMPISDNQNQLKARVEKDGGGATACARLPCATTLLCAVRWAA